MSTVLPILRFAPQWGHFREITLTSVILDPLYQRLRLDELPCGFCSFLRRFVVVVLGMGNLGLGCVGADRLRARELLLDPQELLGKIREAVEAEAKVGDGVAF